MIGSRRRELRCSTKGRNEGAHDGKKENESGGVEGDLGCRWSWRQLEGGIRNPKLWKCSQVPRKARGWRHLANRLHRRKGRQWYGKSRQRQEYEWGQQDDMEADNKSLEGLGFVPSSVSDLVRMARTFQGQKLCDKQCHKEGFQV